MKIIEIIDMGVAIASDCYLWKITFYFGNGYLKGSYPLSCEARLVGEQHTSSLKKNPQECIYVGSCHTSTRFGYKIT